MGGLAAAAAMAVALAWVDGTGAVQTVAATVAALAAADAVTVAAAAPAEVARVAVAAGAAATLVA